MPDSGLNIKTIYLKYFMAFALTFGLLMALWDFIDEGKVDIEKIIFISVIFGALMAWRTVATKKNKKTDR